MLITYTDAKTHPFPALNTAYTTVTGTVDPVVEYQAGSGKNIVLRLDSDPLMGTAEERINQLLLASKGARHWSDDSDLKDVLPTYAGRIFKGRDAKFVLNDAVWGENRAQFYGTFGIEYIGSTYSDPRYAILLDHKGKGWLAKSYERPEIALLVEAMQDKWWGQCALISSGNTDKLGEFFDYMSDLVVLTYSDAGEAKLKHLGVPYARIPAPTNDLRYGADIRAIGERLSYKLAKEE